MKIYIYPLIIFIISTCFLKAQNYGLVFNNNIYVNITNSCNLVIDNPNPTGIIVANSGNIISEGENNVVKWNIGAGTGVYNVPFTTSLASGLVKIPLEVNVTTAGTGIGTIIFSTFETGNDDNTTYPSDVTNMNSNCNNNNGLFAVDRFWRIDAQNYTTKPTPSIKFGYNPNTNETGVSNTINQAALKAERFNSTATSWETPQKLYGLANTTTSMVASVNVTPADFYKSWTLVDTTIMTFTVTALSQSVCSGAQAVLTPSGGATYTLFPSGVVSSSNFSVIPTANTSYTIMGTIGTGTAICNSYPSTSAMPSVIINANPTVAITGNSVVCSGNAVTLNALTADTYSWSNNATTSANTFTPSSSGTYSVVGTNTYVAGNCSSTAQFSITVNSTPTIAITGNSVVCSGNAVTLNALTANTYSWSNNATSSANTFTPSSSGNYSVVGTNTYVAGNCSSSAQYSITVNSTPTVTVNSPTTCASSSVVITASANPTSGSTYSWSSGGVTTNTINVSPTSNTNYTVTVTNNGCNGFAVSSVSVTATGIPVTGFAYNSPICINASDPSPVPVSGFASNGVYSSSAGISVNASTGLITLSTSTPGSYVVTYSVAASGCGSAGSGTTNIVITNTTSPNTNFTFVSPVCLSGANPTPSLATGFSNGGNYSAPTGLTIDANSGVVDLTNSTAGSYSVNYNIAATSGCQIAGQGLATLTINATPTINLSSNVTINLGSTTQLIANSSVSSFTWGPATNLSCVTCSNPIASPSITTTYCLKTSDGVCTNSACVTVSVENPCPTNNQLALPNAFSPNEDGNNDVFCFQGWSCVSAFSIMIFDRWGEKVFETNDPSGCWDGTYKGRLLDPAVFVYFAKAVFSGGISAEKKGNITLIK